MKKWCHGKPPANCCNDGARSRVWRAAVAALAEGLMPFPYVFEMREMKKKRPPSSLVYSQARAKRRGERSVFLCVFFTTSLSLAASGPLAFVEVNTVVFGCEAYSLRVKAGLCPLPSQSQVVTVAPQHWIGPHPTWPWASESLHTYNWGVRGADYYL